MASAAAPQPRDKTISFERLATAMATSAWNPLTSPHWQSVPIVRLRDMLVAVFLSSAAMGFVLEVMTLSLGRRPSGPWPLGGILGGVLFGGATVVFFLVKIRRVGPVRGRFLQVLLLALPLFWYFRSAVAIRIGSFVFQKPAQLTEKALAFNVMLDCIGITLCIFAGYQMFLRFINTEGSAFIRAQTELAAAHAIQHTLVPALSQRSPTVEILGRSVPSEKVGGDIVDSVNAETDTIAYLADVSGHGLSAGILMGMLKTALRATLDSQTIASALLKVNRVLPAVKEPQMYATFACLSHSSVAPRHMQYCVAGHPPILHLSRATSSVVRLSMEQFPLGLLPVSRFETKSVDCGVGDVFVILSDGIVEVEDSAGQEFGLERVEALLHDHGTESLSYIYEAVMASVAAFGKQEDDQSLLLMRIL